MNDAVEQFIDEHLNRKVKLKRGNVYHARLPDKNLTIKVKLLEIYSDSVKLEYRESLSSTAIKTYNTLDVKFHDISRSGKI